MSHPQKGDRNRKLMIDMGSKNGAYTPEAPDMWLYVMNHGRDACERALAWVKSCTVAYGRNSAFAIDEHGKQLYIEHLAVALDWKEQTARNVLAELEAQGRVRLDKGKIWLCAEVPAAHQPSQKRTEDEDPNPVQSYFPSYVADFIEKLPGEKQTAAKQKFIAFAGWRQKFLAEGIASVRGIVDRYEDSICQEIGLVKKRLKKRREAEPRFLDLRLKTEPNFVQSCLTVCTDPKSSLSKPKIESVQNGASLLSSEDRKQKGVPSSSSRSVATKSNGNGGNQTTTTSTHPANGKNGHNGNGSGHTNGNRDARDRELPNLEAIAAAVQQYAVTDAGAIRLLAAACRDVAYDCTLDEIVHFIEVKGPLAKKKTNPMGFLLTAVPNMFTGPELTKYRKCQEAARERAEADRREAEVQKAELKRQRAAEAAAPAYWGELPDAEKRRRLDAAAALLKQQSRYDRLPLDLRHSEAFELAMAEIRGEIERELFLGGKAVSA